MSRKALPDLRELTDPHIGHQLSRLLRREVGRIVRGYISRRKSTRYMPPWDNANGYLQREIYRLVRHFDQSGRSDAIHDLVQDLGRAPTSPTFQQNQFHWALLAMETRHEPLLKPAQRRLFANQLLYALRHGVPELYLIGFIYQIGSKPLTIHERVAGGRTALMVRKLCEADDAASAV